VVKGHPRHAYQNAFDGLQIDLSDAIRLWELTRRLNSNTSTSRRLLGQDPRGRPAPVHTSLHRAIVVAAIGAWESFVERLVEAARDGSDPESWSDRSDWYPIAGRNGQVQTPSSRNVRRLLWSYFHYDPRDVWEVSVRQTLAESGVAGVNWGSHHLTRYKTSKAAAFLDGVVQVRHGFAHQESDRKMRPPAGVAILGRNGTWNVNLHHAENSLRCIVQLAVLTADGLAQHLGERRDVNWTIAMKNDGWKFLLGDGDAFMCVELVWSKRRNNLF